MHLKISSAKWRPFCLGLNVLRPRQNNCHFPGDIFKLIFLNKNLWIFIYTCVSRPHWVWFTLGMSNLNWCQIRNDIAEHVECLQQSIWSYRFAVMQRRVAMEIFSDHEWHIKTIHINKVYFSCLQNQINPTRIYATSNWRLHWINYSTRWRNCNEMPSKPCI